VGNSNYTQQCELCSRIERKMMKMSDTGENDEVVRMETRGHCSSIYINQIP